MFEKVMHQDEVEIGEEGFIRVFAHGALGNNIVTVKVDFDDSGFGFAMPVSPDQARQIGQMLIDAADAAKR